MSDDAWRKLKAWHEAGHSVAAVAQGIAVAAVSLRPGRGFGAITLLGPRVGDLAREEAEHRIIVTLSGRIGEALAEPLSGKPPRDEKRAGRGALRSLALRAPEMAERLLAAEADDDSWSDDNAAHRSSWRLNDYDDEIVGVHLRYLRARAFRTVDDHRHALRQLAAEFYLRTIVIGSEIEAIVKSYRCVCHRDWGPPSALGPAKEAP